MIKIAESTYFQWIQRFFCSLTVKDGIILQIKMYVHKYNHIIVEFQEENRYNINGHKIRLIFGK